MPEPARHSGPPRLLTMGETQERMRVLNQDWHAAIKFEELPAGMYFTQNNVPGCGCTNCCRNMRNEYTVVSDLNSISDGLHETFSFDESCCFCCKRPKEALNVPIEGQKYDYKFERPCCGCGDTTVRVHRAGSEESFGRIIFSDPCGCKCCHELKNVEVRNKVGNMDVPIYTESKHIVCPAICYQPLGLCKQVPILRVIPCFGNLITLLQKLCQDGCKALPCCAPPVPCCCGLMAMQSNLYHPDTENDGNPVGVFEMAHHACCPSCGVRAWGFPFMPLDADTEARALLMGAAIARIGLVDFTSFGRYPVTMPNT